MAGLWSNDYKDNSNSWWHNWHDDNRSSASASLEDGYGQHDSDDDTWPHKKKRAGMWFNNYKGDSKSWWQSWHDGNRSSASSSWEGNHDSHWGKNAWSRDVIHTGYSSNYVSKLDKKEEKQEARINHKDTKCINDLFIVS